MTVCLGYDPLSFADPNDVQLLHFDGDAWVDVTTTSDPDAGLVCGVVSSLSPFAVAETSAEVAPNTTIIQAPADPTIQSTADGAEVQFQFSSTIDTLEHPAAFECRLDDASFTACSSPVERCKASVLHSSSRRR